MNNFALKHSLVLNSRLESLFVRRIVLRAFYLRQNMDGWIKLHRQIEENELYFKEKFDKTHAWIDLLLLATHKKREITIRGIELQLNPGDLIESQKALANRWRWGNHTVIKFLKTLSSEGQIIQKLHHKITIISICNWNTYQNMEDKVTPQTTPQTTPPTRMNKNDKNLKEEDNGSEISKLFIKTWSRNYNNLSEMQAGENLVKEFSIEKVTDAFRKAAEQNKCSIAYVRGILNNNGKKESEIPQYKQQERKFNVIGRTK